MSFWGKVKNDLQEGLKESSGVASERASGGSCSGPVAVVGPVDVPPHEVRKEIRRA